MYQWDIENRIGYKNRLGIYKTECEFKFIQRYLGDGSTRLKILDIGGGSGRFSLKLKKLGHEVFLIDPNEEAIRLAKSRGLINSYCTHIDNFNISDFDIILCIEVLLYVKNPDQFIKKLSKKLKTNGYFIFTINNIKSWRYIIKKKIIKRTYSYIDKSINDYITICKENLLNLEEIYGFHWMPFKLTSNSILIPFFAKMEKLLRLHKFIKQSPWLLIACKKVD